MPFKMYSKNVGQFLTSCKIYFRKRMDTYGFRPKQVDKVLG